MHAGHGRGSETAEPHRAVCCLFPLGAYTAPLATWTLILREEAFSSAAAQGSLPLCLEYSVFSVREFPSASWGYCTEGNSNGLQVEGSIGIPTQTL